jgi:hypothetical protein
MKQDGARHGGIRYCKEASESCPFMMLERNETLGVWVLGSIGKPTSPVNAAGGVDAKAKEESQHASEFVHLPPININAAEHSCKNTTKSSIPPAFGVPSSYGGLCEGAVSSEAAGGVGRVSDSAAGIGFGSAGVPSSSGGLFGGAVFSEAASGVGNVSDRAAVIGSAGGDGGGTGVASKSSGCSSASIHAGGFQFCNKKQEHQVFGAGYAPCFNSVGKEESKCPMFGSGFGSQATSAKEAPNGLNGPSTYVGGKVHGNAFIFGPSTASETFPGFEAGPVPSGFSFGPRPTAPPK